MSTIDAPLPKAPLVPGDKPNILLVRAPYYEDVIDGMTRGAKRILAEAGASVTEINVAGALELPQIIRIALRGREKFDGFVALGCVVKGETDHYDHVCREAMSGLMQVALDFGLSLGTGLLTVAELAQAEARSGADGHNKGAEAAVACLVQIAVARALGAG